MQDKRPEQLGFAWAGPSESRHRMPVTSGIHRRRLIVLEVDESDVWIYRMLTRVRKSADGLSLWLEA